MSEIRLEEILDIKFAAEIQAVLGEAFEPYRNFYTPQAFAQTILTPETIAERILSNEVHVLAAFFDERVAGTVSCRSKTAGELYFQSMGVKPEFEGRGVGSTLLEKIELIARENDFSAIKLDTFHALTPAIRLYEKFGYQITGIEHEWGGVTIFEMKKSLRG